MRAMLSQIFLTTNISSFLYKFHFPDDIYIETKIIQNKAIYFW